MYILTFRGLIAIMLWYSACSVCVALLDRLALLVTDSGRYFLPHSKRGAGVSSFWVQQAETCLHRPALQWEGSENQRKQLMLMIDVWFLALKLPPCMLLLNFHHFVRFGLWLPWARQSLRRWSRILWCGTSWRKLADSVAIISRPLSCVR